MTLDSLVACCVNCSWQVLTVQTQVSVLQGSSNNKLVITLCHCQNHSSFPRQHGSHWDRNCCPFSLVITGFLWSLCFSLILPLPWVLVPVQTKFILQYAFIFLLLNRTIWKPTRHFKQQYYVFFMATKWVLCLSFLRESSQQGWHPSLHKDVFFLHTDCTQNSPAV